MPTRPPHSTRGTRSSNRSFSLQCFTFAEGNRPSRRALRSRGSRSVPEKAQQRMDWFRTQSAGPDRGGGRTCSEARIAAGETIETIERESSATLWAWGTDWTGERWASTAPACQVGMGQWQATRKDSPEGALATMRWAQQAGRRDSARAMGHTYVADQVGPRAAINARTKRNNPLHPFRWCRRPIMDSKLHFWPRESNRLLPGRARR